MDFLEDPSQRQRAMSIASILTNTVEGLLHIPFPFNYFHQAYIVSLETNISICKLKTRHSKENIILFKS